MDSRKSNENKQKRTRIVEIVGPAGAGKTTLCKLLSLTHGIRLSNFPDVRNAANVPFFILYGLRFAPILAHVSQFDGRRLSRREFAWLTILCGWPKVLQKELQKNNSTIVLDQGPVYLLAETSEFGPEYLKRKKAAKFWQDLYSQWAEVLDAIVWLDAADADLMKRVRSRDKEHIVKNEPSESIFEFFARYRYAYERTISGLSAIHPALKIFRFDTSRESPQAIVGQLLLEFGPA